VFTATRTCRRSSPSLYRPSTYSPLSADPLTGVDGLSRDIQLALSTVGSRATVQRMQ
jgi:hypothetical protein